MKLYEGSGNKALTALAAETADSAYVEGHDADETDALGLAIAAHFRWDGLAIMDVFRSALEDANFHAECAIVSEWIETARRC